MSVSIHVNNKYAFIKGRLTPNTVKILSDITSYYVSGFMHAPSFKSKPRRWDGKEHLMSFSPKKGYKIPNGLVEDVVKELEKIGLRVSIESNYEYNGPKIKYNWNAKIKLRPYQTSAVKAICSGEKWKYGSGLLKMPIRSGKTKTAAGIIRRLGRRTLFVVPSRMLLYQTKKALEEALETTVGIIGDGTWELKDVTVATVQTLSKHVGGEKKEKGKKRKKIIPPDEKFVEISKYYDVVIFDESHHLTGNVWHNIIIGFDCRFKIGLSASIHLENEREWERGVIWLKACCGNIRYEVQTAELVKQGHLLKQNIELVKQTEPKGYEEWGWGKELVNSLIYENPYRNKKIVEKAIEKISLGYKVLIVSNRHNQLYELHQLLIENNISHAVVIGKDETSSRNEKIEAFLKNEINVLMGTVFGEGIDIPEIECVINAEGGQDIKATFQRMRNMTPAEGKTKAIFIDFIDLTNKYFAKHSKARLDVYREEEAFKIQIIE